MTREGVKEVRLYGVGSDWASLEAFDAEDIPAAWTEGESHGSWRTNPTGQLELGVRPPAVRLRQHLNLAGLDSALAVLLRRFADDLSSTVLRRQVASLTHQVVHLSRRLDQLESRIHNEAPSTGSLSLNEAQKALEEMAGSLPLEEFRLSSETSPTGIPEIRARVYVSAASRDEFTSKRREILEKLHGSLTSEVAEGLVIQVRRRPTG